MPIVDGLYYSEHKSGHTNLPVILLHGSGSNHLVWPPLMRRLPGWTILALDLPGHGKSTGSACHSVADYAARILMFLAEKQAHQVVLVGHSLGGAIALELALAHPYRVVGLGLVSGGAHFDAPQPMRDAYLTDHSMQDALQVFKALAFSPATPQAQCERYLQPLLRVPSSTLAADWQAGAAFDVRGRMVRMALPAWLAVGADDRLTPPTALHFVKAFLPQAQLQIIPRAGHFVPLEQPAALSDGFCQFLSRLAGDYRHH